MDETILTWSPSNWITVLLMVFLGCFVISVAGRIILGAKGKDNA